MIKTRMIRGFLAVLALGLTAILPGCGSGGLSQVNGSVTYQGKPATGAAVHFHREGATEEEAAVFPLGIVDAEGNFELETPGVGRGALPGQYKVLVLWPTEKAESSPSNTAKGNPSKRRDPKSDTDRLNFRYFQAGSPLLKAEVKAEPTKLEPFELKD